MDPLIRDSNKPSAAAGDPGVSAVIRFAGLLGPKCEEELEKNHDDSKESQAAETKTHPRPTRFPRVGGAQLRTDCRADQQSQHQHKVHIALKCMRHDAVAGAEHDFE